MSAGRRAARDPGLPERPGRDRLPRGRAGDRLPHVRLPLPGPRRHPGDADRRGREAGGRRSGGDRSRRRRGAPWRRPGRHARGGRGAAARTAARRTTVGARRRRCPRPTASRPSTFCGMGGSAVAGDVRPRRSSASVSASPSTSTGAPCCPPTAGRTRWWSPRRTRGNTAETLAAFARGGRARLPDRRDHLGRHARRASRATPGSPSSASPAATSPGPRSGHLALRVARRAGGDGAPARSSADDVDETVAELDRASSGARSGVATRRQPRQAARRTIGERIPVIWGAEGIGAVAAMRWKTPDERERQGARVRGLDVRARPQRGRGLDGARTGSVAR